MQKLICVHGGDTSELDKLTHAGWKITSISSSATSCVANGTPAFYSFCHVLLEL